MAQTHASRTRKPRKIRFLDVEWERVEKRAHACGLPAATYVRKAALGIKLQLGRDLQRLQPLQQRSFQRSLPISKAQLVTATLVAAHSFAREQGHER
jgi:hypothetical protein